MPFQLVARLTIWGPLSLFVFTTGVRTQCDRAGNSCYNALFPCDNSTALKEAVDYCLTVGAYGATNYPPQATVVCGNGDKSPYFAACRCAVDCPSHATPSIPDPIIVSIVSTLSGTNSSTTLAFSSPTDTLNCIASSCSVDLPSNSGYPTVSTTTAMSSLTGGESASPGSPLSTSVTDMTFTLPTSPNTTMSAPAESAASSSVSDSTDASSSRSEPLTSDGGASIPTGGSNSGITDIPSTTSRPGQPGQTSSMVLPSSRITATTGDSVSHPSGDTTMTGPGPSMAASKTASALTSSPGGMDVGSSSSGSGSAFDTLPITSTAPLSTIPSDTHTPTSPTSSLASVSSVLANSGFTSALFSNTTTTQSFTASLIPSSTMSPSTMTAPVPSNTPSGSQSAISGTTTNTSSSSTSTSTSTTTPPPCIASPSPFGTSILDNGGFENGLSPWSVDLVDLFSTEYALATLTSPGGGESGANGSCTAFVTTMLANPQTQDLRENLRLRSDLVFSLPGDVLRISFFVRFAQRNAARLVLSANDEKLRVLSAFDYGPGGDENGSGMGMGTRTISNGSGISGVGEGVWTHIVIDYTTRDRLLQLSFSYELDSVPGNTLWLDEVGIFPSGISYPPQPPLPPSSPPVTTFLTARGQAQGR